jgi:hypothetical protein
MKKYIIIFLMMSVFTAYSQEPTDKEIGFDREAIKKELYENHPFFKKEFIDSQIEEFRKGVVLRYKLGRDEWFKRQLGSTTEITQKRNASSSRAIGYSGFNGCAESTFNSSILNPLTHWTLLYGFWGNLTNSNFQSTNSATGNNLVINSETRFEIQSVANDPYLNHPQLQGQTGILPTTNFLKIGNAVNGGRVDKIKKTFTLQSSDDIIFYRFAIVLQDPFHGSRPFFSIRIFKNGELVECSVINYEAPDGTSAITTPGFIQIQNSPVWVRPWSANVIKPSDFDADPLDEIAVEVIASDCGAGGHFGYGYFDIECKNSEDIILSSSPISCGTPIQFAPGIELPQSGYNWSIINDNNEIIAGPFYTPTIEHTFLYSGTYKAVLEIPYFTTTEGCQISSRFEKSISLPLCPPPPCVDCASFSPLAGEKYIISGWIKEKDINGKDVEVRKYIYPNIEIKYVDQTDTGIGSPIKFYPSGQLIDGWQRITGEFTIPANIEKLHIGLFNDGSNNIAYFDDIRVNPVNGSLKSFVYDQETQKLMAELDENNYGTFYEYDKEGSLIRIKKETEKGIFTIQESRSGTSKKSAQNEND